MKRSILLAIAAIALVLGGATSFAQIFIPGNLARLPNAVTKVALSAKWTTFRPAQNGFKFANTFRNNFISEFDVRTSGLCGGMVWAALDYWKARKRIPQQTYLPTEGSTLQSYLYNRQVSSLAENADKWAELKFNPGGARNNEFWRWGLEGKPGGRIDELSRLIDAGQPAPLGLAGCDEGCMGDHQVLAIGYDLGRYKGDLGTNIGDFKIFIYDPNHPNDIRTLVADPANHKYHYLEDTSENWRTYFVDSKWRLHNPPTIGGNAHELLVTFKTGEDDLRGGSDNVNVVLHTSDRGDVRFANVNQGKRWISYSSQTVALPLPANLGFDKITGIGVNHTGPSYGLLNKSSADNWDLDDIEVQTGDTDGKRRLFGRSGSPLFRFQMAGRTAQWYFAQAAAERNLVASFETGSDDLRGGNDNLNLVLLLRNGREIRFNNVNAGRKWTDRSVKTVYLKLPDGVTHDSIGGVRLETTFGGGVGGDNWNLEAMDIGVQSGESKEGLFYDRKDPLFRFTGDRRSYTWRW